MAVIYRITNMATGGYYIGSAESFERRRWQHEYDLKRGVHKNPRLQAAWNKYGPDMFVFEVLEPVPSDRHAFDIENTYLMKCVGQPDCYNINGDAFKPRQDIPHTPEARAKISRAVAAAVAEGRAGKFIPTADTRAKMSASARGNKNALGYKRTDAEREAIRQRTLGNKNFLGKHHTEESKAKMSKRVRVTFPDGTTQEFASLTKVLAATGLKMPTLRRALTQDGPLTKGPRKGYRFEYISD